MSMCFFLQYSKSTLQSLFFQVHLISQSSHTYLPLDIAYQIRRLQSEVAFINQAMGIIRFLLGIDFWVKTIKSEVNMAWKWNNRKSRNNSWNTPFQMVHFDMFLLWPTTFGNFSPEENSWNQLHTYLPLDIAYQIRRLQSEVAFINQAMGIIRFLLGIDFWVKTILSLFIIDSLTQCLLNFEMSMCFFLQYSNSTLQSLFFYLFFSL
jgi:hypothetical protein